MGGVKIESVVRGGISGGIEWIVRVGGVQGVMFVDVECGVDSV